MSEEIRYPAMSLQQLAVRYCVSRQTIKKWLKPFEAELGPRIGQIYSPRQVSIIFSHLE